MPRGRFAKNLAGLRFGRLLVLERAPNARRGMAKWHCRCDCGNESAPLTSGLLSQGTISCGCHRLTVIGKNKHCARCEEWKLHKEFYRERRRIANRAEREGVLNAYGRHCVCCGETEEQFLAVDHKNGGGGRHRKELGFSG